MIASENFAPLAVMQAQGSVLTNKYAEGYPGRRYYGGCEHVDVVEQLAIDRLKALFGAEYANVQPHSGRAGQRRRHGRAAAAGRHDPRPRPRPRRPPHPRHAAQLLRPAVQGRAPTTSARTTTCIDMDEVARLAHEHRPKVIIAGWSAYPRQLDFAAFRRIADEVGAYLMVDMAHFAGLVAAGLHPSPLPHAHVVTTTTHKTLGGPRGGVILGQSAEPGRKKINSAVFPGQQGGPLEHVIAAKAVAFKLAAGDGVPRPAGADAATARGCWPTGCSPTTRAARGQRGQRRHRRAPGPGGPARTPSSTASRPRTGCTGRASPSTATRCPSTRARPWSAPVCGSALPRWPPAASVADEFTEVADIIAAALRPRADESTLDALRHRVGDAGAAQFPSTRPRVATVMAPR